MDAGTFDWAASGKSKTAPHTMHIIPYHLTACTSSPSLHYYYCPSPPTGKFPRLCEPNAAYHGLNFYDTFGPKGVLGVNGAFAVLARVEVRERGGRRCVSCAY